MQLSRLRPVYDQQGPFATVYLEGRSPADDSPTQTRLRWKDQRERLAAAGADTEALDAIEAALTDAQAGEIQTDGRVLVATRTGLAFDAWWDAALGSGDAAHWESMPELGAYVREEARSVRMLVAVVEEQGAVVRQEVATAEHNLKDVHASTVEKATPHQVHKPRGQALHHNQIQRRVNQSVQRDARAVVAHLGTVAATFDPQLLVLAGEVQQRTAIRKELPPDLAALCTEVSRGGTDDAAAEGALAEELRRIASEDSARHAAERGEQFQQATAHDLAAEGIDMVTQAAERGAVDTLLLDYTTPPSAEAELLRTCAATDATVDLADTDMAQGVGAVLRFPLPTPAEAESSTAESQA